MRVDEHRAARALENLAFHGRQQGVSAPIALGDLERFVDDAHAVIAADGHEVGAHALVGLAKSLDKLFVRGRRVRGRIVMRRDHAQSAVAHVIELIVIGHVTGTDELDAGLVHAALKKLLHHRSACAGGHKHKQRVGLEVAHLLQKRGKVGVAQGHTQRLGHLSAVKQHALLEKFLGVNAGTVVADQRDHLLDAILGRPIPHGDSCLRQRKAGAHDIRGRFRDA